MIRRTNTAMITLQLPLLLLIHPHEFRFVCPSNMASSECDIKGMKRKYFNFDTRMVKAKTIVWCIAPKG